MTRLIDADALECDTEWSEYADDYISYSKTEINNAPTIDAVPVVRCKDCIYYQDNNDGYPNADCKWCEDETPDADDYCSCGAKMDEEKDDE